MLKQLLGVLGMQSVGSYVLDRASQLWPHLTITRKFQSDTQATCGSESLGSGVSCFVSNYPGAAGVEHRSLGHDTEQLLTQLEGKRSFHGAATQNSF